MKLGMIVRWSLVLLTSWGAVLPRGAMGAEGSPIVARERIGDVALDDSGALHGTLVAASGQPQRDERLEVRRAGQLVAATSTGSTGQFVVPDLPPGVYQLTTDRSATLLRAWSNRAAPPSARPAALLVDGPVVIRGQSWGPWQRALILSGVIITSGVVGGVIGYNLKDDAS
jgi:hypothetical protein